MGKIIIRSILILILVIIILFGIEYLDLKLTRFFASRRENIKREVFENTKSYTHGKIQDLAKYYREYYEAESEADKQIIVKLIRIQFVEFDATQISNNDLKKFLINTRGY